MKGLAPKGFRKAKKLMQGSPRVLFRPPQIPGYGSSQSLPSTRSMDDDSSSTATTTFNMQLEVVELREKLKQLTNAAGEDPMELIELLEEKESDLASMHSKTTELEKNLTQLADAYRELESEKIELDKNIVAIRADSDSSTAEFERLIQKIKEESKSNCDCITQMYEQKLESVAIEHEKQLALGKTEQKRLSEENLQIERHTNIREKEVATLSYRCKKGEEAVQKTLMEKEEALLELDKIQTNLVEMERDFFELKKNHDSVKVNVEKLNADKITLHTENKNATKDLEETKILLSKSKEAENNYIEKIRSMEVLIEKKENKINMLQSKWSEETSKLTMDVKSREIAAKALQKKKDDLETRLTDLHTCQDKTAKDLNKKITAKSEEIQKLQEQKREDEIGFSRKLSMMENELIDEKKRRENIIKDKNGIIQEQEQKYLSMEKRIEGIILELNEEKKANDFNKTTSDSLTITLKEKENEILKLTRCHDAQIAEKEQHLSYLKSELEVLNDGLNKIEQDYERMENELVGKIKEKDENICDLGRSSKNFEMKIDLLNKTIQENEKEKHQAQSSIFNLEEQLRKKTADQAENHGKIANLEKDLRAKNETVCVINSSLRKSDLRLQTLEEDISLRHEEVLKLKRIIDLKEKEIDTLEKDRTKLKEEKDFTSKKLESLILEQNKKNEGLEKQCKELQDELRKEVSTSQHKLKKLIREQNTAAEADSEKTEKLTHANKTIENYSKKINALEAEVSSYKGIVGSMREKISTAGFEHDRIVKSFLIEENNLREQMKGIVYSNQILVEKLKNELSSVHSCLQSRTEENSLLEEKLVQQKNTVHALQAQMMDQVQKLNNLEHTISVMKSEGVILNEKSKTELRKKEVDNERLRQDCALQEKKYTALEVNYEQTITKLNERTTLLSNMVEKNKEMTADLEEHQSISNELQMLRVEYRQKYDESESEKKKLGNEIREITALINAEKDISQDLRYELKDLQNTVLFMKANRKNVLSLEQENKSLKDKIGRQEAYLKRKLEKDRILKDRGTVFNMRNPTSSESQDGVLDKFCHVTRRRNSKTSNDENDENVYTSM